MNKSRVASPRARKQQEPIAAAKKSASKKSTSKKSTSKNKKSVDGSETGSTTAPPTIAPHHLAHLAQSGITPATASAAGIITIDDPEEARRLLRWQPGGAPPQVPGLWFPYNETYGRYRPDNPRVVDGQPAKYEGPYGTPSRIYMPRALCPTIDDPNSELWILEGEKKALAHTQAGFTTVGIAGVWQLNDPVRRKAAKEKGEDELILHDDLKSVITPGRSVTLLFDADVDANLDIVLALARAVKLLTEAGANVYVSYIPHVEELPK